MRRAIFFVLGAFFVLAVYEGGALTGQEIAERAYRVFQAQQDTFTDYTARVTQVTKDKKGGEMARVRGKLFFKKPDKVLVDVVEYYEGARKKEPPKRRDDDLQFKLPLEKDYFRDYRFTYKAAEDVSGKRCYRLGFRATKEDEGYVFGSIWISADDYKVVKGTGQPYVRPPHCSTLKLTMYFDDFDGRTMLSKVSTYARATFLLFINQDIYMTSTYSGYAFNQGIPDSKFR
jgi:outer membrane lipoprotein-sorting protein